MATHRQQACEESLLWSSMARFTSTCLTTFAHSFACEGAGEWRVQWENSHKQPAMGHTGSRGFSTRCILPNDELANMMVVYKIADFLITLIFYNMCLVSSLVIDCYHVMVTGCWHSISRSYPVNIDTQWFVLCFIYLWFIGELRINKDHVNSTVPHRVFVIIHSFSLLSDMIN